VAHEAQEKIRRFIDRGLARYGRGQLREAVAEWEQALAWDSANAEARTLIDFVQRKLLSDEEQSDPDRRNTEPAMPRYEDAGLLNQDEFGLNDAPTVISSDDLIEDLLDDDADTDPHERVRTPTLESPIPQLLAQITDPEFEAPADRDEGAPEVPVFGDDTRRLGSEPHMTDDGRVPSTMDLPSTNAATEMRTLAAELVDRCRAMLEHGKLEAAAGAAESALREGDRAPHPGISEVIEPARPLFERVFEAYLGSMDAVPILAISEGVLATQGLDHRAGFMLSRIDGLMTVEHLLDIAGMPRFEALRILASLLRGKTIRIV
jgi:hypothetical protein